MSFNGNSSDNLRMTEPFERRKDDVKEVMRDRRIVRMVRSFMDKSAVYRESHVELALKSRALYENWHPTSRSIIQRANLKLPFGFTIIETQVPQLMDIFWRSGLPIQFKGQDFEDAEWENAITDFHTHQFEEMQFQVKAAGFKKAMLLDGTAFAKIPYRFQEIRTVRRESQIDPVTGETARVKREVDEVLFDGPDFDLVPIYDFFPDWSVKNPGDIAAMRGCVHRTFKTLNSLRKSGIYKNLDDVQFSVKSKGTQAWAPPFYANENFKRDFEHLQDNRHSGIKDEGQVEVWEYWGLWDSDGEGNFEPYILTLANGDVVIRAEKNFYG